MRSYGLPNIIWGRLTAIDVGDVRGLEHDETGEIVPVPAAVSPADLADLVAPGVVRLRLARTPVQDIIRFLNRVGTRWKARDCSQRILYVRALRRFAGASPEQAELIADWIALTLTSRSRMYEMLDAELGDWRVVDDWRRREDTEVRALPRGLALHVTAGNMPLAALLSLVRGLLTKNVCIMKTASQDPLTLHHVVRTFAEVDADHPVTRSVSVLHTDGSSPEMTQLAAAADVLCVWGGAAAVAWAVEHRAPDATLIAHGPRESLVVVGPGADLQRVADGIAHDVCEYDQAACFSARQVVVARSEADGLTAALATAFREYETLLPPGTWTDDTFARLRMFRSEQIMLGASVDGPDDCRWTISTADAAPVATHQRHRTLIVHVVDDPASALDYVTSATQTVGVAPAALAVALRDRLTEAGADRVVEPGLASLFRSGGPHDGQYPLHGFVRWVAHEDPGTSLGKGMPTSFDQTKVLRHGRILDFVF